MLKHWNLVKKFPLWKLDNIFWGIRNIRTKTGLLGAKITPKQNNLL